MERKPRVFFPILSSRFNTTGATKFGQLVFLIKTENFSPFATDEVLMLFKRELARSGFDPEFDFFGFTGPGIFLTLFGMVLARHFHSVRGLMFDSRTGEYVERRIPLGGVGNGG